MVLLIISLLSFAGMGVLHKCGDRLNCNPLQVSLLTMSVGTLISVVQTVGIQGRPLQATPLSVIAVALLCGMAAAIGLWTFQAGLKHGFIVTSWLIVNLASGLPALLSVLIYNEPLTQRKLAIFVLIALSIILVGLDRRSPTIAASSTPST